MREVGYRESSERVEAEVHLYCRRFEVEVRFWIHSIWCGSRAFCLRQVERCGYCAENRESLVFQ